MKTDWIIAFLIILALIFTAPWQAFQTHWTVYPGQEKVVRWHECLSDGLFSISGITLDRQLLGYTIENNGVAPIVIFACD